jgi:hypothetical protein
LLVSSFRGRCIEPTGCRCIANFREATEARGNSSPRRARHKPSNHCAGKAGLFPASPVVFPCALLAQCSAQGPWVPAGTRSSLRPLFEEGRDVSKARAERAAGTRDRVHFHEIRIGASISCRERPPVIVTPRGSLRLRLQRETMKPMRGSNGTQGAEGRAFRSAALADLSPAAAISRGGIFPRLPRPLRQVRKPLGNLGNRQRRMS